ncbi:MAG TPA: M1 family aminopeptidase [Gemmatimonadaceae bacterium]|nr:M1 family aminopeptidase [Gemmatimonadaceae bacterium]
MLWILLSALALTGDSAVVGAPTPDSLAHLVVNRFATASGPAFDSVYSDPVGRMVVHRALDGHLSREPGLARVLAVRGDGAVLLITGTVHDGKGHGLSTGGDETNTVRRFSGLYEARRSDGRWRLIRQLPFDTLNLIRTQALHVAIVPGTESRILDTLGVDVGSPYGLAVRLNNAARITSLRLDGQSSPYRFAGGVLWIRAPRRPHSRLVLAYTIPADTVALAYGAMHNTDAWHPFFNYDSGNDLAKMTVTATIPAEYHLSTTVPQTERVEHGQRIVHGETIRPEFLLALIYDKDWKPAEKKVGDLTYETFVTPDFKFSIDTLADIAGREYAYLRARFGEPPDPPHYQATIEDRELHGQGYAVRMNDAAVTGDHTTFLDDPNLGPSYAYAHEISHMWTMNASGPASNLLREGWATYAEAAMLGQTYGPALERAFWERTATSYFAGKRFEGKQSILGNPDNGRIHYTKGSWLLHSLNAVLGDSVFDRGMREFIGKCGLGPDGYPELIAAMSHAAGHDMAAFIMPWLTGRYVPDVDAKVENARLIVSQDQPEILFDLPLDVELTTAAGVERRSVHLTARADTLDVSELGAVSKVRVDPDHKYLRRPHWGETATFTLVAPQAKTVELTMSQAPLPATRVGDRWTVTHALPEGRYVYLWRIDGKPPSDDAALAAIKSGASDSTAVAGVRTVRPLERLENTSDY